MSRSSRLPLLGRVFVVTRASGRRQGGALARLLRERGARVVAFPSIRIVPPRSRRRLDEACLGAAGFDWIVFTSSNGVEAFGRRLAELRIPIAALRRVRIGAVGSRTARECRERGLSVGVVPESFTARDLARAFRAGDLAGRTVLHPRGDRAGPALACALRRRGARVTEVVAYRTVRARLSAAAIRRLCGLRRIDVLTFASGETVRHFRAILGARRARALAGRSATAVIGPITAAVADRSGFPPAILARPSTVEGLVKASERYFSR
ncbi:MAG: uroporphyrinogen-III synthase [Planctomycetes bacterium]|nr:uroporphyrinogen-III synthase [Planctomycetota bacterium]